MTRKIYLNLVLLYCLTFFGCQPLPEYQSETISFNNIDLSKYNTDGFFFTPYVYEGEFNSIGIITMQIFPGALFPNQLSGNPQQNLERKFYDIRFVYRDISLQEAFDSLYFYAKNMGANGISSIRITPFYTSYDMGYLSNKNVLKPYTIKAFAIKRLRE